MPLLFLCGTIEQMFGQRAHHKYYNILAFSNKILQYFSLYFTLSVLHRELKYYNIFSK